MAGRHGETAPKVELTMAVVPFPRVKAADTIEE